MNFKGFWRVRGMTLSRRIYNVQMVEFKCTVGLEAKEFFIISKASRSMDFFMSLLGSFFLVDIF